MGTTRVRVVAGLSELMGSAAIVLLAFAMANPREDQIFALWGFVAVIACAASAVAAVVMCAASKIIQTIVRQTMAEQAAEYLRRHEL